jgi:hypothetical protein
MSAQPEESAMETPRAREPFRISPYCVELTSKKKVLSSRPPRDEAELLDASGHCWCARTMHSVGPDGEVVDPLDCQVGRSCFRPYSGG